MDYCDSEWFALELNRDHSVIFEIASKYCIGLDTTSSRLDTTKDRISDLEAKSEEVTYNKIGQLFL